MFRLLVLVILTFTIDAEAGYMNKFKEGFYFEKYKTAEQAQNALTKFYPIGTGVKRLLKTLESAGAVHSPITNTDYKDKPQYRNYISYEYKNSKIFGLFVYNYIVGVNFSMNNKSEREIEKIKVLYQFPFLKRYLL